MKPFDPANYMETILNRWKSGELTPLQTSNLIKDVERTLTGAKRPKVFFNQVAYDKTAALVDACANEIAWDCFVKRDPENPLNFYVEDVIVYPQYVSGAAVNTDDIEYNEYLNGLTNEQFNMRRGQGHSHVNFSVSPSATDLQHRIDSVRNIPDFFVFFIFNKKGDSECQITDIENGFIYEDKDIDIIYPTNPQQEWANNQIAEHVKVRTPYNFRNGNAYKPPIHEKTEAAFAKTKGSKYDISFDEKYAKYKARYAKPEQSTLPKMNHKMPEAEARKEFFKNLTNMSLEEVKKLYGEKEGE